MTDRIHYELPPLGYAYDALEPAYSAELLELHYAVHHRAYVDGANRALDTLAAMRAIGDFNRINQVEKDLAFHLSGHVLHSIFWRNLEPNDGAPPSRTARSRHPRRLSAASNRCATSSAPRRLRCRAPAG